MKLLSSAAVLPDRYQRCVFFSNSRLSLVSKSSRNRQVSFYISTRYCFMKVRHKILLVTIPNENLLKYTIVNFTKQNFTT